MLILKLTTLNSKFPYFGALTNPYGAEELSIGTEYKRSLFLAV